MAKNVVSAGLSILFLITAVLSPALAQDESGESEPSEEQIRTLFQEGVEQLNQENLQEAHNRFQRAIEVANQLDPGIRGELLRWIWERSTHKTFNRMLQNPELRDSALRIMELSRGAYWEWRMDQERIGRLVSQLTGSYQEYLEAQRRLISAGQYAAPRLIDELDADSTERRTRSVLTLSRMGSRVILPLLESLKTENDLQRENVTLVLGELQDRRAVPYLKDLVENDPNEHVRQQARASLKRILNPEKGKHHYEVEDPGRTYEFESRMSEGEHIHVIEDPYGEEHTFRIEHDPDVQQHELTVTDREGNTYDVVIRTVNDREGQEMPRIPDASQLFRELAEKYLFAHPDVMTRLYGDSLIWSWDSEQQMPVAREVPGFLQNNILASRTAIEGLENDVTNQNLWPVLVNTYFSIYHESEIGLRQARKMVRGEQTNTKMIEETALEQMEQDLADRNLSLLPGEIVGAELIYDALSHALNHDKTHVAISNMNILRTLGDAGDLPRARGQQANGGQMSGNSAIGQPLINALRHQNRRIRYNAAILIANLEPHRSIRHGNKVIPALASAVETSGIRLVLLADRDQERFNRLQEFLRNPDLRTHVTGARTSEELLRRAKESPDEDILLIEGELLSNVVYDFSVPGREEPHQQRVIDALKEDVRTAQKPLIVYSSSEERLNELRNIFGDRVDQYVQLENPTVETFNEEVLSVHAEIGMDSIQRQRAEDIARRAAKALADINPRKTIFSNYAKAVPALVGTLGDRPSDLQRFSARAIGRFADERGVKPLTETLANSDAANGVRKAAGNALARIFEQNDLSPEDAVLERIAEVALNAPFSVRMAAGRAFGGASISPERRKELLDNLRPDTKLGRDREDLR